MNDEDRKRESATDAGQEKNSVLGAAKTLITGIFYQKL
jgi:hypothetical protein